MSFKIWNDSDDGRRCRIEVDGEDISGAFNKLSITADIKSAVEIELEMGVFEQERTNGDVRLVFAGKDTRELLIKHGWTPPSE
jgi:hypothetical protein